MCSNDSFATDSPELFEEPFESHDLIAALSEGADFSVAFEALEHLVLMRDRDGQREEQLAALLAREASRAGSRRCRFLFRATEERAFVSASATVSLAWARALVSSSSA
jgi:hypothetical protein